jgi:hypothetical protein
VSGYWLLKKGCVPWSLMSSSHDRIRVEWEVRNPYLRHCHWSHQLLPIIDGSAVSYWRQSLVLVEKRLTWLITTLDRKLTRMKKNMIISHPVTCRQTIQSYIKSIARSSKLYIFLIKYDFIAIQGLYSALITRANTLYSQSNFHKNVRPHSLKITTDKKKTYLNYCISMKNSCIC